MVRTPDTSDRVIDTRDRLLRPLVLLAVRLPEQVRFHQDLVLLEVSDANGLFAAVDVVALDNGVLVRARGDADFDLRVCGSERGEVVEEKLARGSRVSIEFSHCPTHSQFASLGFDRKRWQRRKK